MLIWYKCNCAFQSVRFIQRHCLTCRFDFVVANRSTLQLDTLMHKAFSPDVCNSRCTWSPSERRWWSLRFIAMLLYFNNYARKNNSRPVMQSEKPERDCAANLLFDSQIRVQIVIRFVCHLLP